MLDWFEANRFLVDMSLITTLLAMSMYIAFNAGIMSLGSVGFMAIGGYGTAILTTRHDVPMVVGILAGTVTGALLAGLFGLAILRLSGIYLALGTFALSQATIIFIEAVDFTGGVHGIIRIPRAYTTWGSVGMLVLLGMVLQFIRRSHYGRAMRAVRLDVVVAQGLGIASRRYQMFAFVLSGAVASFAGALEAHESTVISPSQYNFTVLVIALTYAMVGGAEHWVGPLVAALILTIFREYTRDTGTDYQNLAYGILLVTLLMVLPGGLADPRLMSFGRRIKRVFTRRDLEAPPLLPLAETEAR